MKIVFTDSFLKRLNKLWNIKKDNIFDLIKKYPDTNNLILLDFFDNSKILKWYLLSKNIRIMILFEFCKWKFIPFYIWKKETKKCNNITKNNYIDLFWNDIDKILNEVINKKVEEIEFTKD